MNHIYCNGFSFSLFSPSSQKVFIFGFPFTSRISLNSRLKLLKTWSALYVISEQWILRGSPLLSILKRKYCDRALLIRVPGLLTWRLCWLCHQTDSIWASSLQPLQRSRVRCAGLSWFSERHQACVWSESFWPPREGSETCAIFLWHDLDHFWLEDRKPPCKRPQLSRPAISCKLWYKIISEVNCKKFILCKHQTLV